MLVTACGCCQSVDSLGPAGQSPPAARVRAGHTQRLVPRLLIDSPDPIDTVAATVERAWGAPLHLERFEGGIDGCSTESGVEWDVALEPLPDTFEEEPGWTSYPYVLFVDIDGSARAHRQLAHDKLHRLAERLGREQYRLLAERVHGGLARTDDASLLYIDTDQSLDSVADAVSWVIGRPAVQQVTDAAVRWRWDDDSHGPRAVGYRNWMFRNELDVTHGHLFPFRHCLYVWWPEQGHRFLYGEPRAGVAHRTAQRHAFVDELRRALPWRSYTEDVPARRPPSQLPVVSALPRGFPFSATCHCTRPVDPERVRRHPERRILRDPGRGYDGKHRYTVHAPGACESCGEGGWPLTVAYEPP